MTAPVDVLAVMDRLSYALQDRAGIVVEVNAARAAVAELIDSLPALLDIVRGRAPTALGVIRRTEAALARVQGVQS